MLRKAITVADRLSGVMMAAGHKVAVLHLEELLDWQGALLTVCKNASSLTLSSYIHVHNGAYTSIRGAYLVTDSSLFHFDALQLVYTHPCCFASFCSFSTDRVALRDDDE